MAQISKEAKGLLKWLAVAFGSLFIVVVVLINANGTWESDYYTKQIGGERRMMLDAGNFNSVSSCSVFQESDSLVIIFMLSSRDIDFVAGFSSFQFQVNGVKSSEDCFSIQMGYNHHLKIDSDIELFNSILLQESQKADKVVMYYRMPLSKLEKKQTLDFKFNLVSTSSKKNFKIQKTIRMYRWPAFRGRRLFCVNGIVTLPSDLLYVTQGTHNYYTSIETGITANSSSNKVVLYLDDFKLERL